ncbi:hypothetical protein Tco_1285629 [Tanacetum coccineum]
MSYDGRGRDMSSVQIGFRGRTVDWVSERSADYMVHKGLGGTPVSVSLMDEIHMHVIVRTLVPAIGNCVILLIGGVVTEDIIGWCSAIKRYVAARDVTRCWECASLLMAWEVIWLQSEYCLGIETSGSLQCLTQDGAVSGQVNWELWNILKGWAVRQLGGMMGEKGRVLEKYLGNGSGIRYTQSSHVELMAQRWGVQYIALWNAADMDKMLIVSNWVFIGVMIGWELRNLPVFVADHPSDLATLMYSDLLGRRLLDSGAGDDLQTSASKFIRYLEHRARSYRIASQSCSVVEALEI